MKTEIEKMSLARQGFPNQSDYNKAEQAMVIVPVGLFFLGLISLAILLEILK